MSLRIEWFGLSEGAATDARGSTTLVAFSPEFFAVQAFPTTIAPVLVFVAEDEESPAATLAPGMVLSVRVEVSGVDGEGLFLAQNSMTIGEKRIPELPSRINVIAQVPIPVAKPGRYTARVDVSGPDGVSVKGERAFHVLDAAALPT